MLPRRIAFFLFFFACWVFPLLSSLPLAMNPKGTMWGSFIAFDFNLRCHESECLVKGYDPCKVWSGRTPLSDYVPFDPVNGLVSVRAYAKSGARVLHVYPPWSMVMSVPFALMPEGMRYQFFTIAGMIFLAAAALAMFRRERRLLQSTEAALFCIGLGGLAAVPLVTCIQVGNYGVLIAVALLFGILFLERRQDVLSGLCFSITMVKPQIGLLFMLVLLALGRWKPILVVGLVLGLLSAVASLMCGTPPIEMVLSIRDYNSAGYFPGAGLVTAAFGRFLSENVASSAPLVVGLVAGMLVCLPLTRLYAKTGDVFAAFLPATFICTLWAAGGWYHDRSIDCIAFMILGSLTYPHRYDWRSVACAAVVLVSCQARELGASSWPIPNWMICLHFLALAGLGLSLSKSPTGAR